MTLTAAVTSYTPGAPRSTDLRDCGMSFVWTGTGFTVQQLGAWKETGNTGNWVVTLRNSGNTVTLATATISMASGTDNAFNYAACTPFTLVTGTTYLLLVNVPVGQNFNEQGPTSGPRISSLGGKYQVPANGGGTGNSFGAANMYAGVDFLYEPPPPVPAPPVPPLLGTPRVFANDAIQDDLDAHSAALLRKRYLAQRTPFGAYPVVADQLPWRAPHADWRRAFQQDLQDQDDSGHERLLGRIRAALKEPLFPGGTGLVASKMVEYLVIEIPPVPPNSLRQIRWPVAGVYDLDVGYEDVPNLSLKRRIQTPFAAYFVTPPPVPNFPGQQLRMPDREPLETDPIHLARAMRLVTPPSAYGAGPYVPHAPPPLLALQQRVWAAALLEEDELQLTKGLFRRGTPPGAYQVTPQPVSLLSPMIRRNQAAYQEDEEIAAYLSTVRRVSIAAGAAPDETSSYFMVVMMA